MAAPDAAAGKDAAVAHAAATTLMANRARMTSSRGSRLPLKAPDYPLGAFLPGSGRLESAGGRAPAKGGAGPRIACQT
nr:hypothetical protein GCM10020063_048820 [Dactylosporangium thailandense]